MSFRSMTVRGRAVAATEAGTWLVPDTVDSNDMAAIEKAIPAATMAEVAASRSVRGLRSLDIDEFRLLGAGSVLMGSLPCPGVVMAFDSAVTRFRIPAETLHGLATTKAAWSALQFEADRQTLTVSPIAVETKMEFA